MCGRELQHTLAINMRLVRAVQKEVPILQRQLDNTFFKINNLLWHRTSSETMFKHSVTCWCCYVVRVCAMWVHAMNDLEERKTLAMNLSLLQATPRNNLDCKENCTMHASQASWVGFTTSRVGVFKVCQSLLAVVYIVSCPRNCTVIILCFVD